MNITGQTIKRPLFNIVRQVFNEKKHKLGKIMVKHCEPIDLVKYLDKYKS
jgi:glycerol-3-phosphate O-acyltransferase